MCTVTWWRDAARGEYGVWFNRDERRTRPASEPVSLQRTDQGLEYLAPRDPAGGGTWLSANARGLVLGLLNFYAAAAARPRIPIHSRGALPVRCADCGSTAEVEARVRALDATAFAPFILVAWDGAAATAWSWDGAVLTTERNPVAPITTSSFHSAEVCAWRQARYASLFPGEPPAPGRLAGYHDDTAHPDPAYNVRMRRPDARTESVCSVTVSACEVRFVHRREAPDAIAVTDQHEVAIARPR